MTDHWAKTFRAKVNSLLEDRRNWSVDGCGLDESSLNALEQAARVLERAAERLELQELAKTVTKASDSPEERPIRRFQKI